MVLKKTFIISATALVLVLGGFSVTHAEEDSPQPHKGYHHHHFDKANIREFAKKLGIDPTGKTDKELKAEIKAKCKEKLISRAKKLGISNPEGMSFHELKRAVHEKMLDKDPKRLKKLATKLGIKTEGKTNSEIKQEVLNALKAKRHGWLVKKAEELGINTEGKTDEQLHDAIHKKWAEDNE